MASVVLCPLQVDAALEAKVLLPALTTPAARVRLMTLPQLVPVSPSRLAVLLDARFRQDATSTPMSMWELRRLLNNAEGLVHLSSGESHKLGDRAKRPPTLSDLPENDSAVYVGRLSYESPFEVLLLAATSAGAAITVARNLLKLAQEFDKWRVDHATNSNERTRQKIISHFLESLEGRHGGSNHLTFVDLIPDETLLDELPATPEVEAKPNIDPELLANALSRHEDFPPILIPTLEITEIMDQIHSLDVKLVRLDFAGIVEEIELTREQSRSETED